MLALHTFCTLTLLVSREVRKGDTQVYQSCLCLVLHVLLKRKEEKE